jgi:hypothetical protein
MSWIKYESFAFVNENYYCYALEHLITSGISHADHQAASAHGSDHSMPACAPRTPTSKSGSTNPLIAQQSLKPSVITLK